MFFRPWDSTADDYDYGLIGSSDGDDVLLFDKLNFNLFFSPFSLFFFSFFLLVLDREQTKIQRKQFDPLQVYSYHVSTMIKSLLLHVVFLKISFYIWFCLYKTREYIYLSAASICCPLFRNKRPYKKKKKCTDDVK